MINLSSLKSKWKKRDMKIQQEKEKKLADEEEKKRLERMRIEKEIETRRKNARIPHYGGIISTNKNIAMKKFLLRKMEQGTDNMSATQMEAFEKLKRELGDLNKIEKEVKKSTKRRQQFETVVHKAPILTTSDIVDLNKADGGDSNSKNTNKKIISLSSVKSDAFNNKKNKKVDDFLQRDLDYLSGIGSSNRKNSFSNKKKTEKTVIKKKSP